MNTIILIVIVYILLLALILVINARISRINKDIHQAWDDYYWHKDKDETEDKEEEEDNNIE